MTSAAMVSFRGHHAPEWVLDGINSGLIAAVCLFNYNFDSLHGLRRLTDTLRDAARSGGQHPPLIGIDQEGGQLMAVGFGATELPGNMALGATRNPELARAAGCVLAAELLALGCNLNFVPVLDLATRLESRVVGVRAFGSEPALVSSLGVALIDGLQSTGVLASAKHFPGHGRTSDDSHLVSPSVELTSEQLEHDLQPFVAAIAAGVAGMMSSHITYPLLDAAPATLSPAILKDLLRGRLGFQGLVITDAMDMHAVAAVGSPEQTCLASMNAGSDLVLFGHLDNQAELTALLASPSAASRARVAAARKQLAWDLPALETVGSAENRAVAQQIADASVTVLRGEPVLQPGAEPLLISFDSVIATPADSTAGDRLRLLEKLQVRQPAAVELRVGSDADLSDVLTRSTQSAARVIVATDDAVHDPRQQQLVERLVAAGADPILVALRSPLDALLPARHVVCTYGWREPQVEAAARLLFGEIEAVGQLPVTLPGEVVGS